MRRENIPSVSLLRLIIQSLTEMVSYMLYVEDDGNGNQTELIER